MVFKGMVIAGSNGIITGKIIVEILFSKLI